MDLKDNTGELDESDIMMVEEFHRIFNFYKKEKTIHISDDSTLMDLEATILAEKEQAIVTERIKLMLMLMLSTRKSEQLTQMRLWKMSRLHYMNSFFLKQKCSIWIANLPILRMFGK